MLTALIILAICIVGTAVIRWANKPSKRNPNPLGPGKSLAAPKDVFDLMYPHLEEDKTKSDK